MSQSAAEAEDEDEDVEEDEEESGMFVCAQLMLIITTANFHSLLCDV